MTEGKEGEERSVVARVISGEVSGQTSQEGHRA